MAWSLVGSAGSWAPGNSGATVGFDTTGADTIFVCTGATPELDDIVDAYSNVYTQLLLTYTDFAYGSIWYCEAATVGSGHTWQMTGGARYGGGVVFAFSGGLSSGSLDSTGAAVNSGGSSVSTGSRTPSTDDQLVIAVAVSGAYGGATISASNGDGSEETAGGEQSAVCCGSYFIQTTAAAVDAAFTSSGVNIACGQVSFKAAAGGATGQPTIRRFGGIPHALGHGVGGNTGRGKMWGRTRDGLVVPRRFAA